MVAPGAHHGLAARLVEEAGFGAVHMTGSGVANTLLGQPDVGLLTKTEMVMMGRCVASATGSAGDRLPQSDDATLASARARTKGTAAAPGKRAPAIAARLSAGNGDRSAAPSGGRHRPRSTVW